MSGALGWADSLVYLPLDLHRDTKRDRWRHTTTAAAAKPSPARPNGSHLTPFTVYLRPGACSPACPAREHGMGLIDVTSPDQMMPLTKSPGQGSGHTLYPLGRPHKFEIPLPPVATPPSIHLGIGKRRTTVNRPGTLHHPIVERPSLSPCTTTKVRTSCPAQPY